MKSPSTSVTFFHFLIFVTLILIDVSVRAEFVSRDPKTFAERLRRARKILDENPLIDGHNDLALGIHSRKYNLEEFNLGPNLTFYEKASELYGSTDIPQLQEGLIGAQIWDTWVSCTSRGYDPVVKTLEEIDDMKRIMEDYPEDLQFVDTSEGVFDVFVDEKIGILISVEGGHMINNSLAVLRTLYNAGVRSMTLTSNCTEWAEDVYEDNGKGLTHYGRLVIEEMNRLGMIIDLAHASAKTCRDVFKASAAPVIFSHSAAHALCDDPRNIKNETLRKLASNDGIIMINFSPEVLTCSETATVHDIIDHINFIRDLIGVRHIGLGSNFDRLKSGTEGLENYGQYPNLFAELLLDSSWTEEDIKLITGYNFLRVFHIVESVKEFFEPEAPVENIIIHALEDDDPFI